MSVKFSKKQIEELLKNKNVLNCSDKSIKYSPEFKIKAVEMNKDNITPKVIFQKEGFDLNILGRNRPHSCLNLWNRIYNEKGEKGLINESRGGNKINETDKEKLKRLELENEYLRRENDFLAQLREKRGY